MGSRPLRIIFKPYSLKAKKTIRQKVKPIGEQRPTSQHRRTASQSSAKALIE